MTQMKGLSLKCQDDPRGEGRDQTGPEKAQAGRPGWIGPGHFCGGLAHPLT
jgi:hypothetical protein